MSVQTSLAIIVPVYNEQDAVGRVIDALLDVRGDAPWELIFVDDGSSDKSSEILAVYGDKIRIIRHPSNRGYGASLKTGIKSTRAENVLLFDSDGQHEASDIPRFVEELKSNECVFGMRNFGEGVPFIRKPGKWILQRVCNFLTGDKVPDINCGFRAGRRKIYMRMLDLLPDGFSFSITSMIYSLKSRHLVKFIPITTYAREGKSSVRIVHDGIKAILLSLRLVMLFDPMRAFGFPAVILLIIGCIYQVYIFAATGLHIEGGAILAILAGIILFHFGLLGDQVASLRKEISSHNSLYWEEHEFKDELTRKSS